LIPALYFMPESLTEGGAGATSRQSRL
jgi:hypothetical protein